MNLSGILAGGEGAVYLQQAEELQELAADPTLQSCCQRDLRDQIRIAECKAKLAPQDRSQIRNQMAKRVIAASYGEDKWGSSDSDEESEELGALRERRMREIQAQMHSRRTLQSEGHGNLTSISEQNLDLIVGDSTAFHVVCHITCEGDTVGEEVDEILEALAQRFLGTRFLRCAVQPKSTLPLRYGLELPSGIVCFYKGDVVGVRPFQHYFESGASADDDSEALEFWLRQRKCLLSLDEALRLCSGDNEDRSSGSLRYKSEERIEEENEGNDWQAPCEVCGRRYPHQHIRSMYRTAPDEIESD